MQRFISRLNLFGGVVMLLGIALPAQAEYKPSAAFKKLTVYRQSETASLKYAAKYFWRIYGSKTLQHGRLQAVRPLLGLPSFVQRGRVLFVEYLGDVTGVAALRAGGGPRYQLIRKGETCQKSNCFTLGAARVVKVTKMHGSIVHVRVAVAVPAHVPAHFYDLVHFLPKITRQNSKETPKTSKTAPRRSTPPGRRGASSAPAAKKKGKKPSKKTVVTSFYTWRSPSAVRVTYLPPAKRKKFAFVHFTDPHLRADVGKRLHLAIGWINKLAPAPDFVVITGDLVEYGSQRSMWKLMRREVLRLKIPAFISLGNHDYYRFRVGQQSPPAGVMKEEVGLRNYLRYFHPFLAYRFAFGGYRFLAVDTGSSATAKTWWRLKWVTTQGIGDGQLRDIQKFLRSRARIGHVLLGHAPPRASVSHTSNGCSPGLHASFLVHRGTLEELLRKSYKKRPRPIVYLHGHTHWNDIFVRSERPNCRFIRFPVRHKMMGSLPCWRSLPLRLSPLLLSTQSGTKHQPLRSGGWHQRGMKLGEGSGAGFGFRVVKVKGRHWKSASFRFYHRTRVWARRHPDGYINPASSLLSGLPSCSR